MCSWVLEDAPETGKSGDDITAVRSPKKKQARREHVKQYLDWGLTEDAVMHEGTFVALY